MPNTREKLLELSRQLRYCAVDNDCINCERWELDCGSRKCLDDLLLKAAELLESVANGVTVQQWISVKDRLPEDGEIVLVCGSRGGVYTAVFNKPGQYRGWHKLNSKSHYCDPTHWMPLPQPPEEQRHKHFPTGVANI